MHGSSELVYDLSLGVALAMDAMVVSIVIGMLLPRGAFGLAARPPALFGTAQAAMVALGWLVGAPLHALLDASILRVVVFAVLVVLGLKMAWEASRPGDDDVAAPSWPALFSLALATSIDALGAGVGLRLLGREDIVLSALTVGLVTALLCLVGTLGGRGLGPVLGRYPLWIGAATLVGLGVVALVSD